MGRMSYRDRLDRMAAEKAAGERERQEKAAKRKAAPPASGTRRRAAPAAAVSSDRVRVVWGVFDAMGGLVTSFPFPEKDKADAKAAELTEQKNKKHFVQRHKVPMD